jgi:hypothetical protein
LGGIDIAGESSLPVRVELIPQRGQRDWVQPVNSAGSGSHVFHQAGILEDLQVLGYR